MALTLMAIGGGFVAWPMWLLLSQAQEKISELEVELDGVRKGATRVVEGERQIGAARDLPSADRIGVLLDDSRPPARRVS